MFKKCNNEFFTQHSTKNPCYMKKYLPTNTRHRSNICQSWRHDVYQVYSFKELRLWVKLLSALCFTTVQYMYFKKCLIINFDNCWNFCIIQSVFHTINEFFNFFPPKISAEFFHTLSDGMLLMANSRKWSPVPTKKQCLI